MNERDAPALLIGFIDSGFFREIRIKYITVYNILICIPSLRQVILWLVTAIDSSACILNHCRAVVVAAFQGSLAVGVVVAVSLHFLAEVIHAEVIVLRQIDCLPPAFPRVPVADEVRLAVRVLGAWHILVTAVHAMII